MPRRINREEPAVEPLPEKHLLLRQPEQAVPTQRRWIPDDEWKQLQDHRDQRRRERTEERERRRIYEAIDWAGPCIVPGCEREPPHRIAGEIPEWRRDTDEEIPLCYRHQTVAWAQVELRDTSSQLFAVYAHLFRQAEQRRAEAVEKEKRDFLARTDGHIYFVQQNGLIKVGWTRRLRSRLREYGAGVEVLAYYKATRDDETHLHRQLTPFRAKGREWYADGPMLRDLVADVVSKHGEPDIDLWWTEPKEVIKQRRR